MDNDKHHDDGDHSNIHNRDDVPCVHRSMCVVLERRLDVPGWRMDAVEQYLSGKWNELRLLRATLARVRSRRLPHGRMFTKHLPARWRPVDNQHDDHAADYDSDQLDYAHDQQHDDIDDDHDRVAVWDVRI